MAAVSTKAKLGTRFAKGLKYVHVAGGTDVQTVRNALEHYPSRNVRKAAKARARGRAALGRYPLIGDRPGQCLVSDGFETRIGRADKAKPIQTKKFAIHTLGQSATFGTAWSHVWNAAINRH